MTTYAPKRWLDSNVLTNIQKFQQSETQNSSGYFVYHLDALQQHIATLQQQKGIKLWYAVKANPLSNVIQTLAKEGMCFDVASKGELQQVLKQGVDASNILNTGPAKSKAQISEFMAAGVNIFVAESLNQLLWLEQVAAAQQKTPQVLLRVQLQWPEGEKNPLGGNALTPFGLSPHEWQNISLHDYPNISICGLHIFQWGNMLSNEKMMSLWSQMVTPLTDLAAHIGFSLDILDLGGGLGLDYLTQQQALSWQQIVEDLANIKQQAKAQQIWLELGRFAVGRFGYYVVPVVDKKLNYEQPQLVLEAGINHLLRPAITEQPFPVALLRESNAEIENIHIHGPLCTSMDKLGLLALPSDVDVGDYLVFGYCGAYGFTESMPYFLCHSIAAEYILQDNQFIEVRATQTAQSYLV
jgi:diaminopimelate decarboxylase